MRHQYNLGFICDDDLLELVSEFVQCRGDFSMLCINELYTSIVQIILDCEQQGGWLWSNHLNIFFHYAKNSIVGYNDLIKILDKLIRERGAVCYWVNMGATETMDTTLQHDGHPIERTRIVSWDAFFTHITSNPKAFAMLNMALANEIAEQTKTKQF